MGILDFIQRARKAQQDNPQKHDVQLELKTDGPYRITVIPPAPLAPVTEYEWPTEDEIAERRWSELEALWEDYDLSRADELTDDADDDRLWDSNELPADFLRGDN